MLQQLADWLALQGEFDEEWVLAVNPESVRSVLTRSEEKAKSALHASSRKALGAFAEPATKKRAKCSDHAGFFSSRRQSYNNSSGA